MKNIENCLGKHSTLSIDEAPGGYRVSIWAIKEGDVDKQFSSVVGLSIKQALEMLDAKLIGLTYIDMVKA